MKTLTLLVLLFGASLAWADDAGTNLLKNGDFSSGINHWEGDLESVDTASPDTSGGPAPTSGVIVKLHHDWSKVTQDFAGKIGEYNLMVKYAVSPDIKLSTDQEDYNNVPRQLGYSDLLGFDAHPGQWCLLFVDLAAGHYTYWSIRPQLTGTGTQTVHSHVHVDSDDHNDKVFALVFPPGHGFINLQSITLTPIATASN